MTKNSDLDFDFGIDFMTEEYNQLDINGLVLKMKSKKRILVNFESEVKQLNAACGRLPNKEECIKAISIGGGWSCLAFILWVAEKEVIEEMFVTTFRIGKKHFEKLCELYENGMILNAHFITSSTQKRVDDVMTYKDREYKYFDFVNKKCADQKWDLHIYDNHSKIVLMKTKKNYYVLETSSNLNENPKMEHFSFENDKELFEFYKQVFDALMQ